MARIPTSPSKPKTHRNVVIGLVVGVILAFALAALLERIDRRVRTVEELEELFGCRSSLAFHAVEHSPPRASRTCWRCPRPRHQDPAHDLRYFNVDRRIASLLIASPGPE